MKPLPAWTQQGVQIGIVGGQEFVDEKYQFLKDQGVPMVGIWMQDWVGEYKFPEATRLLWNWQLNREWYDEWDRMVDGWAEDGVRPMVYMNPYFADLSDFDVTLRRDLFKEGVEGGYFVKN